MKLYITITISSKGTKMAKFLRQRICERGGSISHPDYSMHINKDEFESLISLLSHGLEFKLSIHQIYFDF